MKVTWEVDDGYVGGSRPHTTNIDELDIEDCEDIDEAMEMVRDMIQEDYDQKINWFITKEEEIKNKIADILENKKDEEEDEVDFGLPNGIYCPECNEEEDLIFRYSYANGDEYFCQNCKNTFTF